MRKPPSLKAALVWMAISIFWIAMSLGRASQKSASPTWRYVIIGFWTVLLLYWARIAWTTWQRQR